jgi:hypothetical protein
LADIHVLMSAQLNKNTDLLLTYFNVMILSKAFKLDKLLQTSSKNNNYIKINSNQPNGEDNSQQKSDTNHRGGPRKKSSSLNMYKATRKSGSLRQDNDLYEGDGELSVMEVFNETKATTTGVSTAAASSKYDLILFPRILELCISYIISVKQQQKIDMNIIFSQSGTVDKEKFDLKYSKFNQAIEQFSKRLLYLLKSCILNVQIMLNNVRLRQNKLLKFKKHFNH